MRSPIPSPASHGVRYYPRARGSYETARLVSESLVLLRELAEASAHLVAHVVEEPLEELRALARHLELHRSDVRDRVLHLERDHVPTDLLVALLRDHLHRRVVEEADDLHHADRLAQRAHEVVLAEAVLLQEVLTDDARDLDGALLVLRERVLADELHDLLQLVLRLQDLAELLLQRLVLRLRLLEERLERADVLGEADVPVHGREVLALRQLLVQAPEHLHDRQRRGRHGVGEVATRRGHGADNRDGALASRAAAARDTTRPLIERRQARAEVGRVARVRRHLRETTRDLTQRLGPARRRVGHHAHVVALVAEVLGRRHAGVDRSLTRRHWHVRRVRHERRPLHDLLLHAVDERRELREIRQHLGHLVAALATAHVHDHVRVRVLAQGLRDHRLAAPEGARHRARPAERRREEGVDHALAREHRHLARELLHEGPALAHRPEVRQAHLVHLAVRVDLDERVLRRVAALADDPLHAARELRRDHHAVLTEETVLANRADDVAAAHQVANTDRLRHELPLLRHVQRRDVNAARHKHRLRHRLNLLERALDAVENVVKDARAELQRERLAGLDDRVTDRQPRGVLVHLNAGRVALDLDDLAHELLPADAHHLVHLRARHATRHDQRPRDLDARPVRLTTAH